MQKMMLFHRFALEKCLTLKILQSELLTAFWPMSQEQHFSQIGDFYKNTVNNVNFLIIEQIQGKLITKFLFKFKKLYFWPIFLFLGGGGEGGQKIFSQKIWHAFLVSCRNSEKPNDPIPRKQPNRQQDGRINRPFVIGPFQLLLGV